jgi:hypothetical protein
MNNRIRSILNSFATDATIKHNKRSSAVITFNNLSFLIVIILIINSLAAVSAIKIVEFFSAFFPGAHDSHPEFITRAQ